MEEVSHPVPGCVPSDALGPSVTPCWRLGEWPEGRGAGQGAQAARLLTLCRYCQLTLGTGEHPSPSNRWPEFAKFII